ncbi:hypothetical protein Q5P01_015529 [Channa striata]|uniref:Uncharacterized protein n=1 Tax=Channa striata TaxID=64152 RepID=A0AA88SEN2_CHASR|nr:hypothetical protein Q5P01_015529 [Channa striata]
MGFTRTASPKETAVRQSSVLKAHAAAQGRRKKNSQQQPVNSNIWTKESTFLHSGNSKHQVKVQNNERKTGSSLLPSGGQKGPLQRSGAPGTKGGRRNNGLDSREQQRGHGEASV